MTVFIVVEGLATVAKFLLLPNEFDKELFDAPRPRGRADLY